MLQSVEHRDERLLIDFSAHVQVLNNIVESSVNNWPGLDTLKELARGISVDGRTQASIDAYFPGALSSSVVDHKLADALYARGYTKDNTLFATSVCPDEVNAIPGEMVDLMKTRWGESFALGGLGGVPFVGKAGFSAYAHHAVRRPVLLCRGAFCSAPTCASSAVKNCSFAAVM